MRKPAMWIDFLRYLLAKQRTVQGHRSYATFLPKSVNGRSPVTSSRSMPAMSFTGTRTWSMVSLSRMVTVSSSMVSKSMVMENGVPTSSLRL